MTTWSAEAAAIAATINDAGGDVWAYTDPQEAYSNRPCVLVALPTFGTSAPVNLDGGPELTWSLIALASRDTGPVENRDEIGALVDGVWDLFRVLDFRPLSYPIGADKVPAYGITITTL